MKRTLRRTLVAALLPSLLLVSPTSSTHAIGTATRAQYPLCATAGVTSKCIEEVLINGVALPDIGKQYNSPAPYFKVPNYTAPAGTNYADLVMVSVDELSSLFNIMVKYPGNAMTPGLDPSWQISVRINFGPVDLTYALLRGRLENYLMSVNEAGDVIVTLTARPAGTSWYSQPAGSTWEQWEAACTAPDAKANFEWEPTIYLMVAKMQEKSSPDEDLSGVVASKGMLVSTNYGCGSDPSPLWDFKTSSLVITPKAPHFKMDGTENTGFYAAVIPPAYVLDQFGLSVEEMLGKSLSLTASYSTGAPVPIPMVTSLDANGSVLVTATEDFHYSAPKVRLKKKAGLRTGSKLVKVTSAITKVTRGEVPKGTISFSGVKSGTAYAYVVDQRGAKSLFEKVTIKNGKATLTSTVPTTATLGKAKLLISYAGTSKFARAKLVKKITIT